MGSRHEQTFLPRRHPDGQQTHEKMLNITNHQGNTNGDQHDIIKKKENQNYNEISRHTCQNG